MLCVNGSNCQIASRGETTWFRKEIIDVIPLTHGRLWMFPLKLKEAEENSLSKTRQHGNPCSFC